MSRRTIRVLVVVEADEIYCDNNCCFMTADVKKCTLFGQDLRWDGRKKHNGNRRVPGCRDAQELPREIEEKS